MLASKILSRLSRSIGRRSPLLLSPSQNHHQLPTLSNQFYSLAHGNPSECITSKVCPFRHSVLSSSPFKTFGFTSSASHESTEKEPGNAVEHESPPTNAQSDKTNGSAKLSDQVEDSASQETQKSDSVSESESDLSRDDLVKLVMEKEELLKAKHKEIEAMQDKALRTCAEMENVMKRTQREAENSKKFAIQNFAKSLLDVADNLERAASVVKGNFAKIDASNDTTGVAPLLKTLLEGVEMTEKQLAEVFKKYGLEKFDPTNEPFDPHRHNALFQVPEASKPPGTVTAVIKAGYMLYDRVIRPAEVGVTQAVENGAEANIER